MLNSSSLVSYSGSSSEDETTDDKPTDKTSEDAEKPVAHAVTHSHDKQIEKLPVPEDIKGLYSKASPSITDKPAEHGGRIRSFPHMEGNWATLVYIPYYHVDELGKLQEQLLTCLKPLEFQPQTDFHISLSRTVTVRHHWIHDLVDSLKKQFGQLESCACQIEAVKVYTNDEKNRSFLALQVTTGSDVLQDYVCAVDSCFREYNLDKYYEPPSFHISIGWCLGDVTADISDQTNAKLQKLVDTALTEDPEMKYFYVDEVRCKTGNKLFQFPLQNT